MWLTKDKTEKENKKSVLITGATSGIGKALAKKYSKQGYQVIACGRNKEKLAKLEKQYSNISTLAFDITNNDEIQQVAIQVNNLDIFILNAGDCQYIDDIINFESEKFAQVINTNLVALGYLLHHFLSKVNSGGQLVFISSSATILPFTKAQAYGASKAGIDYLAKSLSIDLHPHNITVSLVHPGFVKTPLTDKNTFDMPFMITSNEAAEQIYKGVAKRKRYIHFPKRLTLLLKLFSILPDCLWRSIMLRSSNT